jgi:hypothetical protein
MPSDSCPRCDRPVPDESRFCPQCGLALGEVVYRDDDEAKKSLVTQIGLVEETIARLEGEMKAVGAGAEERIQQAQLEVQPTQIETPRQPEVPEPYPPPGEADPPSQPEIPEPYPPPGELDPPAQPDVPEPFPPSEPE